MNRGHQQGVLQMGRHVVSTPTGRPDRPASAFDYAPRRLREQWNRGETYDATEAEPAHDPPRDLDEDARTARSDADDRSSLVPKGPHENVVDVWNEAEDERAERWDDDEPTYRAAYDPHADADAGGVAYDAQYEDEEPADDPYDEHLERLAATLRSLQRGGDETSPEQPDATHAEPARSAYPDADDRELYIDGTRLPRFLQSSYVPPPEREGGIGHLGAMLAAGIACVVAAPLAYYVALGNPFASAPRAIQAKPELQYAVASTSASLPRPEQQGAPVASAVAPNAPVAWAEPHAQPTGSLKAPRSVPLTHVTRWPDPAQDSGATQPPWTPSAAPASGPPRADAAPVAAPDAYALAAVPPSTAASSQPRPPALDADEITLLLKQGQDFIAAGDFVTARVVLRRAAEAGAAAAALALGQTYDPKALAKMRARGVVPDAAEARRWYETAQRLGSGDAAQRLERLARDE
jgi:hypothetical protein